MFRRRKMSRSHSKRSFRRGAARVHPLNSMNARTGSRGGHRL